MIDSYIDSLVRYGIKKRLVYPEDRVYCVNSLLALLGRDSYTESESLPDCPLPELLGKLTDYACENGLIDDDITQRDLFDTKLMGVLTPAPHEVQREFRTKYAESPQNATEYYYQFSKDVNYIRWDRICKNLQWKAHTDYGGLDLTINLSKPELPPTSLAALKAAPKGGYPQCLLCKENEGYAGRLNHPARQNLRLIPLTLDKSGWYLQYSPYGYYNEHCIVFNEAHTPMAINRHTLSCLLDFVEQFPHYFVGSNADLPIVGGSILTHDHFQGGKYKFAMELAPIQTPLYFNGYSDVHTGIVNWPMSVIRLRGADKQRVLLLADKILTVWRGYTDKTVDIYAETDVPHNTITPIARRNGADFELDLVLRNNRTTEQYPLGIFHPHNELHHIKKENIGLIEVMGLAVLPPRLKTGLARLEQALVSGENPYDIEQIAKHADWAAQLCSRYTFTVENVHEIMQREVGVVFSQVLEQAGVFKRTEQGSTAFIRFTEAVNRA